VNFAEIKVGGSAGAFNDQIDGKDIEPGLYDVKWPDGSVSTEAVAVEIELSKRVISEHGHPYSCSVKTAVIQWTYRGLPVRTEARGLLLRSVIRDSGFYWVRVATAATSVSFAPYRSWMPAWFDGRDTWWLIGDGSMIGRPERSIEEVGDRLNPPGITEPSSQA
jgi:hypothetical protein